MNDYSIQATRVTGRIEHFQVRAEGPEEARDLLELAIKEMLTEYTIKIDLLECVDPCTDFHTHIRMTNCRRCNAFQLCVESRCMSCWKI